MDMGINNTKPHTLIFHSSKEDPFGSIRDLKGFTARKMIKSIEANQQESRKEWLIWMFERAGKKNSNVTKRHRSDS